MCCVQKNPALVNGIGISYRNPGLGVTQDF